MDIRQKSIAVVVLTILFMFPLRKFVESVFNLIAILKDLKKPNNPDRVESAGIVFNAKTEKLESSGGEFVKLPF